MTNQKCRRFLKWKRKEQPTQDTFRAITAMLDHTDKATPRLRYTVFSMSSDDEDEGMANCDLGPSTPDRTNENKIGRSLTNNFSGILLEKSAATAAPPSSLLNHTSNLPKQQKEAKPTQHVSKHFKHSQISALDMLPSRAKCQNLQHHKHPSSRQSAPIASKKLARLPKGDIHSNDSEATSIIPRTSYCRRLCGGEGSSRATPHLAPPSLEYTGTLSGALTNKRRRPLVVDKSDQEEMSLHNARHARGIDQSQGMVDSCLRSTSNERNPHPSSSRPVRACKRELPPSVKESLRLEALAPRKHFSAKRSYGKGRPADLSDFLVGLDEDEANDLSDQAFVPDSDGEERSSESDDSTMKDKSRQDNYASDYYCQFSITDANADEAGHLNRCRISDAPERSISQDDELYVQSGIDKTPGNHITTSGSHSPQNSIGPSHTMKQTERPQTRMYTLSNTPEASSIAFVSQSFDFPLTSVISHRGLPCHDATNQYNAELDFARDVPLPSVEGTAERDARAKRRKRH